MRILLTWDEFVEMAVKGLAEKYGAGFEIEETVTKEPHGFPVDRPSLIEITIK